MTPITRRSFIQSAACTGIVLGTQSFSDAAADGRPIRVVNFWMKAFIPKNAFLSYEIVRGHTVIPLPPDIAFSTDQRGFDPSPETAGTRRSRMITRFTLSFGNTVSIRASNACGPTHGWNIFTGRKIFTGTASTERMKVSLVESDGPRGKAVVKIQCSANIPYLPRLFTPDIDYAATITVDPVNRTLLFDGLTDGYPAFEGYASFGLHDGVPPTTVPLFQILPPRFNTPENLSLPMNKPIRRLVRDINRNGRWESTEVS
jgi:hypothetical protein